MSSLSEKSAFEAFARMEERIENNERQLKASVEIDEEISGDRLANQFKQLERGAASTSVDMRLIELKQKMGMLPAGAPPSQRQLGTGGNADRDEETVHAEIDDTDNEKKGS
jgi:phage shock protein A